MDYQGQNIQFTTVYLMAGGEPHQTCTTFHWTAPYLTAPSIFQLNVHANPDSQGGNLEPI